jgi:gamma-glutamyltranspeptidase/glutathione hydrolase
VLEIKRRKNKMVTSRFRNRSIFLALLLIASIPSLLQGAQAEPVCGSDGVVAASHKRAAEAAIEILQQGGNAVDAAVAAAFTIGVVEPHASGLGGGGGMVIYLDGEDRSYFIDYYGAASHSVGELGSYDRDRYRHTAKSILVPGTVAGLTLAMEKFGNLPIEKVLAPAIRCAREGFEIDETLGGLLLDSVELLENNQETADVFLGEMGFPLMTGDTLKQPELAATLEEIVQHGRDGFYKGRVAREIVEGISELGGVITLKDLESYQAELAEPLRGNYRDCEIIAANPPLSGASVIEALNILENRDLKSMGHYTESAATLHFMVETFRLTHADRYPFLGDPEFGYVPVNGLISKDYAQTRYHEINQFQADPPRYRDTMEGSPTLFDHKEDSGRKKKKREDKDWSDVNEFGKPADSWGEDIFDSFGAKKKPDKSGDKEDDEKGEPSKIPAAGSNTISIECLVPDEASTTHLSVIDGDGNAVSLTQTLGTFFGSAQTVSGVLFNCGMSNFSRTRPVNVIEPGKRPRTSICPTIVLKNGELFLVVGTPGASRIVSTVVEVLVNLIDFDMDIAEANNTPRFYTSKYEDYLHLEGGISEEVREKLSRMGHPIRVHGGFDLFFGGAHLIHVNQDTGMACGSADPRRSGTAISK